MPEIPDLEVYLDALRRRVVGRALEGIRIASPFLLRTVAPSPDEACGRRVLGVRRVGKRIVLACERDLFLVVHLMIAGRLQWKPPRAPLPKRVGLAAFDFVEGSLQLTEAGSTRRASLHVVAGEAALAALDPGGLEPLACTRAEFAHALRRERHTLKRALTDPTLLAGIGNAYSDEILHAARLSPVVLTTSLDDDAVARLHDATRTTLAAWIERLRAEAGDGFPERVTAFREGMAVHGRYGEPCPRCGAKVQRIRRTGHETNYCAPCQTDGRLLADRSLSRLLKDDWPRTLEEMEERKRTRRG